MFILLFYNLFLLSLSLDIIKDLPFNIYHVEDMNQYENKIIPIGNKHFIRLPPCNSENNITFYLTIPKNISLFPIYSAEFSKYQSDKEITDINFKDEIELIKREDFHYSIYSFNIKNT